MATSSSCAAGSLRLKKPRLGHLPPPRAPPHPDPPRLRPPAHLGQKRAMTRCSLSWAAVLRSLRRFCTRTALARAAARRPRPGPRRSTITRQACCCSTSRRHPSCAPSLCRLPPAVVVLVFVSPPSCRDDLGVCSAPVRAFVVVTSYSVLRVVTKRIQPCDRLEGVGESHRSEQQRGTRPRAVQGRTKVGGIRNITSA